MTPSRLITFKRLRRITRGGSKLHFTFKIKNKFIQVFIIDIWPLQVLVGFCSAICQCWVSFGLYCGPFGIPGVKVEGRGRICWFSPLPPPLCAQFPLACQSPFPFPRWFYTRHPRLLVCRLTRHCVKFMYRAQVGGLLTQTYTVAARWPWWFTHHCHHCALFCTCATPPMVEISTTVY